MLDNYNADQAKSRKHLDYVMQMQLDAAAIDLQKKGRHMLADDSPGSSGLYNSQVQLLINTYFSYNYVAGEISRDTRTMPCLLGTLYFYGLYLQLGEKCP